MPIVVQNKYNINAGFRRKYRYKQTNIVGTKDLKGKPKALKKFLPWEINPAFSKATMSCNDRFVPINREDLSGIIKNNEITIPITVIIKNLIKISPRSTVIGK